MNTIIYLLQVTACSAAFYLFYFLFLSRLTFFTTNRWYLLATVLLSFLIPLLRITLSEQQPYVAAVQHIIYVPQTMPLDVPTVIQQAPVAAEPVRWDAIFKIAYFTMAIALGIHLLVTMLSFLNQIKGKRIAKIGKVNILSGQQKIANGSFLNYIFLNEDELSPDEIAQIIAHEMLHIKLYHSIDRILVKIAQILLWFNPFIYLYARSVEENHEFEVDREIARSTDKHNYANLLLHLSVVGQGMLYHNFSKVPLKKRISMLFNKPSNKMKRITYVLIVPVVLVSCLAFARLRKANAPVSQHSVVADLSLLGKNPLVIIDNKVYKKDILYKIGRSCIKNSTVFLPKPDLVLHGVAIKDGYVEIETKSGKITYLTPLEKENLAKEYTIPNNQYYTRLHLRQEDGTYYDKIIISMPSGAKVGQELSPSDKVGFMTNIKTKKIYNEEEFKKILPSVIDSFAGYLGTTTSLAIDGKKIKGYDIIMFVGNKKPKVDANNQKAIIKKEVKKTKAPVPQYSAVGDLSRLGKTPLVTIDDKIYKKDILYTISPSCIKGVGIFNPDPKVIKHGIAIKDGYVEIKTKAGDITYLTALEKENLIKEYSIPKDQYFTRLHLKQNDGTYYDKIIVSMPLLHGRVSRSISPTTKPGFVIDKKLYNEEEFKKILPMVIASFTGEYSTSSAKNNNFNHGVDVSGYDVIFSFNTKNPESLNKIHNKVTMSADSVVDDTRHQLHYIYGDVHIAYGDFKLNADFVRIDDINHLIFASGRIDPLTKRYTGRPVFKMGKENQSVTSDSLLFHDISNKVHIWNGSNEQDLILGASQKSDDYKQKVIHTAEKNPQVAVGKKVYDEILYSITDARSVKNDRRNQLSYFYENAHFTCGDFELNADFIKTDDKKHLIFARGQIDPITKRLTRPTFKMGKENQPIESDSLLIQPETKKVHIWKGSTEQDLIIGASQKSDNYKQKGHALEFAYKNILVSTSDLPFPDTHFGIVVTQGIAERRL